MTGSESISSSIHNAVQKRQHIFFSCACICSILPSVLFPSLTSILSRHRYIPSTLKLPPSPAPRSFPQNLFSKPALDRTRSPRGRWMSSKPPGDQNRAPSPQPGWRASTSTTSPLAQVSHPWGHFSNVFFTLFVLGLVAGSKSWLKTQGGKSTFAPNPTTTGTTQRSRSLSRYSTQMKQRFW